MTIQRSYIKQVLKIAYSDHVTKNRCPSSNVKIVFSWYWSREVLKTHIIVMRDNTNNMRVFELTELNRKKGKTLDNLVQPVQGRNIPNQRTLERHHEGRRRLEKMWWCKIKSHHKKINSYYWYTGDNRMPLSTIAFIRYFSIGKLARI